MRTPADFTDPERLRDQYGDAARLTVRADTHRRFNERDFDFRSWIIAQLNVGPGQLVADIGCGPGGYFGKLLARGARVVGCDLSPGMAAEARSAGGGVVVADAQLLPFTSSSIDRVMCNHVLYHVPDQGRALIEMRRVCRPGGRVVISTNGRDHLKAFHALTTQAAADIGRELAPRQSPFSLEDTDRVGEVFTQSEVRRVDNCLVFPDAEPVIAYLRSWIGPTGALEQAMRRRVDEAIERDGAFRVPTVAGCFVADV